MKTSSLLFSAAAIALFTAAFVAAVSTAQAPQTAPTQPLAAGVPPHEGHNGPHPAPTNLKVLPKTLTGDEVHEIMEGWEAALGTHCDTCHTADPKNLGPNGRPRINFADDSKKDKSTARLMFKMTQEINENYVSMVDNSGAPVTCGTCHRGHLGPEPFVAPKEKHEGPRPPQSAPPHDDDKPEKPQ